MLRGGFAGKLAIQLMEVAPSTSGELKAFWGGLAWGLPDHRRPDEHRRPNRAPRGK